MPNTTSYDVVDASTLLADIARLAHWLPTDEFNRDEVLRDVAEMQTHAGVERPSRDEIYRLRMHVWELHASPFKPLLVHDVAQLGHTVELGAVNRRK